MSLLTIMRDRYSVRAYQNKPVENEKLRKLLEAANLAPTAVNFQPFRIMLLKTAERKEELQRIYHRTWFTEAPIIIAMVAVKSESWTRKDGRNYVDVDAAIAMDHLILEATELGLGTCWIANFDVNVAREVLGLPDDVEPLIFTPLGYPADEQKPKKRKALSEVVMYDKWS
ncbi:nitroreductase family protein [candidate division KSB1 bacterium]|nr:nitroreductase family protein [candidate division KSB1 bacterium]